MNENAKSNKKYELTEETKIVTGFFGEKITLHRIRALKNIGLHVKKGDLGGFVQSEDNLSQEDGSWIYDDACVFDTAKVIGDSRVSDNAIVKDGAIIQRDSWIHDNSIVMGNAMIYRSALYDNCVIGGFAEVRESYLYGVNATDFAVLQNTHLVGRLFIKDCARIANGTDMVTIYGQGSIGGCALIEDSRDFISLSFSIGKPDDSIQVTFCGYRDEDEDKDITVSMECETETRYMSIFKFREYANSTSIPVIKSVAMMIEHYFEVN